LDVLSQEEDEAGTVVEALLPEVDKAAAIELALDYRLDLLNSADEVDDAKRGVRVAKNRILPDLDATGSMTMDTDPNRKNSMSYNTERTTWRAALELRMDDRKTERNAYRASLIGLRRAEREHERRVDSVRADVRRALRRIEEKADLRLIQAMNVDENRLRLEAARAQFDLGQVSNQDVVDAENELLAARNALAGAVADYRVAILDFRLDTGSLRVTDDGRWGIMGGAARSEPPATEPGSGP
jgi:outer membrane protein TolC